MFIGDYTVVVVLCETQRGALHIIFIGRDASLNIPGWVKG